MPLTKYEKKRYPVSEDEDAAYIQTYNAGLRKRLAVFCKNHQPLLLEKSFAKDGVIYAL